ncbi:MAG: carboxypeptidase-like regulatory domain-containing protein, partial [Bacteroidetes bacterium]|nr:carboxypeptidase-like regulatory domain-containing protein [Bacteroidota bacterium]
MKRIGILLTFILVSFFANAQNDAIVFGRILDSNGVAAKSVTIAIIGTNQGTYSDNYGNFELTVPSGKLFTLVFSSVGFTTKKINLILTSGERKELAVKFSGEITSLNTIEIKEIRNTTFMRIDPKTIDFIPGGNNGVEAIIKTMPGVISNNELSSQYSVRGGNYDENLVYVNDIEIYRPFLV